MDKYEVLFARLDEIEITTEFNKSYSCSILFKEFIRRFSLLYIELDRDQPFNLGFLKGISGESLEFDQLVKKYIKPKYIKSFGMGAYIIMHSYLFWEFVRDDFYFDNKKIEPFEPFIRILERNGRIDREHGIYDVCGYSFYLNMDTNETPYILDMSDENLDKIDAELS